MFSAVVKKIKSSPRNSFLISREFGALTQKSWGNHSLPHGAESMGTKMPMKMLKEKVVSDQSFQTTDAMLESLFSRNLPLPHYAIMQNVNTNCYLELPALYQREDLRSIDEPDYSTQSQPIHVLNRNNRKAKKANKGARPCSRVGRRKRKEAIGKRSR